MHDPGGWRPEGFVTENAANDWEPVIAASTTGDFHIAWDSYRGDYDVMLRTLRSTGEWGSEMPVAQSSRLENHAALSVDEQNRLWIAWEAGPEHWASDSAVDGLRARRNVELACFENGKLFRAPEAETLCANWAASRECRRRPSPWDMTGSSDYTSGSP